MRIGRLLMSRLYKLWGASSHRSYKIDSFYERVPNLCLTRFVIGQLMTVQERHLSSTIVKTSFRFLIRNTIENGHINISIIFRPHFDNNCHVFSVNMWYFFEIIWLTYWLKWHNHLLLPFWPCSDRLNLRLILQKIRLV